MPKRTDTDFIRSISLRCKEIRRLKGYSQELIQENTKINVGRLESGMRNISVVTLKIFCDYCETPISDFFEGMETK